MLKNKKISILVLDGALLAFALLASSLASLMIKYIPPCFFYQRGVICPACGGTRCVESLFKGHIAEAFEYNAFFVLLAFYIALVLIVANLYYLFDVKKLKRFLDIVASYKAVIVGACAFAVFGLVRMVINT